VFTTKQDSHSLPVIMKRLQNITIKRSRGTFNKMSIINKMRALKASASKKQFDVPKLEGSATPESEGEMLWSPQLWFLRAIRSERLLQWMHNSTPESRTLQCSETCSFRTLNACKLQIEYLDLLTLSTQA
jgi:hypothetical protein